MLLHLRNHNIQEQYPLLYKAIADEQISGIICYDKALGRDYLAININSMSDICTILSLAKATNEYCTGLYFNGNDLVISEKAYTLGE